MTFKHIRMLRTVLNDSLDTLEKLYKDQSLDFPSLDESYTDNKAETFTSHPETIQAINVTVSAAYQLINTVRPPFSTLSDVAGAYHLPACLRVAEKFNLVEVLREAGPEGCHVDSISIQCGLEKAKLARVLRVLATHHIFREVAPDAFANNRISSYFDTGKSSKVLFTNPFDKYSGTSGAAAYIGTFTDDVCKASSYLLEDLEDPESGNKYLPNKAALQKAFSMDQVYFSWLEEPSNRYRFERYGPCIRGSSLWDAPEVVLQGFKWESLDPQSLIVDVGGGTGRPAMLLARDHSHLNIVIQEREPVVVQGIQYWKELFPEALSSGRVSFQVHDFFQDQPQTSAAVFLVRTICHDWPDEQALKILSNLRKAASPSTKLVLGDYIIPYACRTDFTVGLRGAQAHVAKEPLLANLGKASANVYWIDMAMQVLLNGQERTLRHHINITAQAGWHITSVFKVDGSQFGYMTAEPIPDATN
ncbi:O-methyltransferase [Gautieria morchelliformis]|nr:O-methyltransferase [Gautieria morchelliformis]